METARTAVFSSSLWSKYLNNFFMVFDDPKFLKISHNLGFEWKKSIKVSLKVVTPMYVLPLVSGRKVKTEISYSVSKNSASTCPTLPYICHPLIRHLWLSHQRYQFVSRQRRASFSHNFRRIGCRPVIQGKRYAIEKREMTYRIRLR